MNNKNTHYAMANAESPEDIIRATQESIMSALIKVFQDIKVDVEHTKVPGLTWEQIFGVLEIMKEKKPTVIFQDRVQ